jgi:Na+/H+ antiporter NhaD/arsenite permease-like protein
MNAILALSVFIIAYGFIAAEKFNRVAIALVGAAAMVIFGATNADAAFFSHETGIDWNVIFVLWWALAFGADFGGNATIIGASANVVAVGLAKKAGIHISFWQFAKYGIPVTFLSVIMVVPYLLLRYL